MKKINPVIKVKNIAKEHSIDSAKRLLQKQLMRTTYLRM